ncbi:MAG: carboxypeptidase regulatory-like domain-containing protein [Planctomycetota bacterium]
MAAGRFRWLLPSLLLVLAALLGALLLTSSPPRPGPDEIEPGTPQPGAPTLDPDDPLRGRPAPPRPAATPEGTRSIGREVDALPAPALDGRLTVVVRTREGAPVAGASVVARFVDPEGLRGAPFDDGDVAAEGTTDAAGTFVAPEPSSRTGWLRVTARAEGHAAAARVVVAADALVELVLGPAGEVRIEVLAQQDAAAGATPAANVDVTLHQGDVRLLATTDADGRVTFHDAPAGPATVRAVTSALQAVENGPFDVAAGAVVERVIVVGAGRTVEGVVVDDADGSPIAGADVWIARPGASTPAGITDAQGRFGPAPAGTDAERQFVAVRAPGFAPALEPVVLRPAEAGTARVSVEVRLRRAEPWRGRVLGVDGAPAAGARVAWTADGVAGRSPASARSDEGGWFTIEPPPPPAPGRRVLLVAESPQGRAALALRPDEPAPSPLELRLVADASVGGRLAASDGTAVAAAEVRLVPVWDDAERRTPDAGDARRLLGNEQGLMPWSAASDASGFWRIDAVPPGRWQVHARTATLARWFPAPVDVGRRDVDVGTLVLDDGLAIAGEVRDADGRPAAGARVDAVAEGLVPRAWDALADADGRFEIQGLPPGTVRVRARRGEHASEPVVVELGTEDRDDVELEVPVGGRVRIEVRTEEGAPFTGVLVLRREPIGGRLAPGRPQAVRAKAGVVEVDDVPVGPAWWRAESPDGRVARTEAPVTVESGGLAQAVLVLGRPAVLEGTVHTAEGEPAASAEVHVRHLDGRGSVLATTDLRGRYRLVDLVPGRHLVIAYGRGGSPVEREIDVPAGVATTLDLDLSPAGRVEVQVLDASGRDVPGALVRFRVAGRLVRARGPARTDARGRAVVEDLPLGLLDAQASHPEAGDGLADVMVEAGRTVRVVIRLAR